MASPVRLVHLSDIHVTASPLGWRRSDWFNKRLTSWLNLHCLDRAARFRKGEEILALLMAELRAQRPDCVIFSGDASNLGLDAEIARAAALLEMSKDDRLPGLAVPGNHDYLTPEFDFCPFQAT